MKTDLFVIAVKLNTHRTNMTCVYCTTELPVDGESKRVTCPKCGSEFNVFTDGWHTYILATDEENKTN